MPRLLVHFYLQASFFVGWTLLHRWGPKHGRIREGEGGGTGYDVAL
jgi:hypothetical protein